ncbi:aminotransferase class IV family protein [Paracoccus isoporae]|uniref:aminotransferase class IV family protein n=1 Tax=Paracoccus isoporae TaxID=591205 RepID=UPI000AED81FC|nr:aminotransferase class IV family protein [Paracoccus isoporae]
MQIRVPGAVPDGLTIIETMRADPEGEIALLDRHLARLRRDCAAVGFPLDQGDVARALATLPRGAVHRVRLTVDAAGQVAVTTQPLDPDPPVWRVAVSEIRLESADPWLRIKSSHRPAYDAARAAMPAGCDEVLLMNERGELCEGSITSLFIRRGRTLLTPPRACGLLPGILRETLLASGAAREAVLRSGDLEGADVLCGNALRGLIPARLI